MQVTAGEAGTNSLVMYSYGPPHTAGQKQDDQLEHTFSSYVRIRDVLLKTYQRRWTIGRSGERGSGISVLARHLNELRSFFHTLKCFHLFLSNTNNSIYYESFVCTQFNFFKYCCESVTIQVNMWSYVVSVPNEKCITPWHHLKYQQLLHFFKYKVTQLFQIQRCFIRTQHFSSN